MIGLLFFIYDNYKNKKNENKQFYYGLFMIIIASITEAIIYFIIKNIKTNNSWNHMFIAYYWSAILSTVYLLFNKNDKNDDNDANKDNMSTIGIAMLINGLIGTIGYYLRFYSIYNLNPEIYAMLSYFGIIMAYFYGMMFNNEKINIYKILGTILIIYSNYKLLL